MFSNELREHLCNCLIPFWIKLQDTEHGGFYGWMDSDLHVDRKAEKGCILNSRILWFFSNAAMCLGKTGQEGSEEADGGQEAGRGDGGAAESSPKGAGRWTKAELQGAADQAYRFLREACVDREKGGVYWAVNYRGEPEDTTKHTYNQAFAVYALSSYFRAYHDREALKLAEELITVIESRCFDVYGYKEALDRDFQPIPNDKLSENGVMAERTMNTLLHVMEAYTEYLLACREAKAAEGTALEKTVDGHEDDRTDDRTKQVEAMAGQDDVSAESKTVSGQDDVNAESKTVTGQDNVSAGSKIVTGQNDVSAECKTVTGQDNVSVESKPVTERDDVSAESKTVTGQDGVGTELKTVSEQGNVTAERGEAGIGQGNFTAEKAEQTERAEAARPHEKLVEAKLRWILNLVETRIYNPKLHRQEVFFNLNMESLIELHSYGHDIEAAWLIDRCLDVLGDAELTRRMSPVLRSLEREVYEKAYSSHSLANECERGVVDTKRVWWVQAEGVVGFYNAWQKTGEIRYRKTSEDIWQFIREHLADKREGGEWFWYTDAEGNPAMEKPIVEPWKCPYHNGRMCMEIVRRSGQCF